MLRHCYLLHNELVQFMNMHGNPVVGLSDSQRLCDLAYMVYNSNHFSELEVKLQGARAVQQLFVRRSSKIISVNSVRAKAFHDSPLCT